MSIPCYPEFEPIALALKPDIQPLLYRLTDGVSEYTFANLYLFRKRYQYRVSIDGDCLIIAGNRDGKRFFITPGGVPGRETLVSLFEQNDYWKGIPDSVFAPRKNLLAEWGVQIAEDRDNFDYLYLRTDLAELPGKKYHKKRNLVNAFLSAYACEIQPLAEEAVPQALAVLDRWRRDKGEDGDYAPAKEALELFTALDMRGVLYYIRGKPAGWCLGETLVQGRMFAVHFEKGIDEYKGIYQYMNQTFAASLEAEITHINREQDLGDEGLRQAKMTYRPSGFVRKYTGVYRP
ncbi:MAG: phosphatidylglycerol lysyltransferase domain-containing protein [Spirochaetaceae bacterium]|jgi:hypothetical protein|nr:phosphatidylglycerol lysyltransferase domain-containing protein [Spirochaetaceae bacterium]